MYQPTAAWDDREHTGLKGMNERVDIDNYIVNRDSQCFCVCSKYHLATLKAFIGGNPKI